ncbi:MAG TPA: biotin--[acetyl-CoA-carboxylase] ligase [Planctomycetota bacterium]|nr:biotin--[acetyl-CoA-carboxylase] ligase [Planctomycetota bacterium]
MEVIRDEILAAFLNEFRPRPQGIAPETISERTGIDKQLLPAVRDRLARDGFLFEDDPEGRWILVNKPDRLLPYWIRAGLKCDRLGSQIYYQDVVTSTQDIAFELLAEGRPHGTLVVADHQTGGRGSGSRLWHSTPGKSLLFSLLLDLEPPGTFVSVLTIAIATSLARSMIEIAGVPAKIKFPNDILVRGKKVAGILLEVKDYGATHRVVAGVGINVNQVHGEFPEEIREIATSLREERKDKEPVRRPRLLRYVLQDLERWLERIRQGDFAELEGVWNRFAAMEGKEVRFRRGSEEVSGTIVEASVREGLLVRVAGGEPKRFRLEHISDFAFV